METFYFEMHLAAFFIILIFTNLIFFVVLLLFVRKSSRRKVLEYNWYMRVVFEQMRPGIFYENCLYFELTKTEITLTRYVCRGLSNKAIGDRMFISEETVKKHVQNIFFKTKVNNRLGLVYRLQNAIEVL
jgi:DNA-binding CsgD family transcriptional regulator